MTAESFKRGWQRLVDPSMATPGEIGYHLSPVMGYDEMASGSAKEISGLTCPDDKTFVVTLSTPMADFLAVCCHPGLAPVPQAAIDDPDSFLLAPIGNGPFMMDGKWESGQYINVKRFEDYYGDKPALDAINFSIQKDPKTAYSELEAGNMDFCQMPTGRIQELTEKFGKSVDGYTISPSRQALLGAEASVYYLAVNLEDETMANKDLRHAISLAINRQNIVDTLFEGGREPADNVFPPIIDKKGGSWEFAEYDPEKAKQLLAEAGVSNLTLDCKIRKGQYEKYMTVIQSYWAEIGVTLNLTVEDSGVWQSDWADGNLEVTALGWFPLYADADNHMYTYFYSANAKGKSSFYNNPEVDELLSAARVSQDKDERASLYKEADHIICHEDFATIPLFWPKNSFAAKSYVKNAKVGNLVYHMFDLDIDTSDPDYKTA